MDPISSQKHTRTL